MVHFTNEGFPANALKSVRKIDGQRTDVRVGGRHGEGDLMESLSACSPVATALCRGGRACATAREKRCRAGGQRLCGARCH